MSSPSKPANLTKVERKAAAALRRPNTANPPRDHRAVKFPTAEENVRRVNTRYARLKIQGEGEEVELMGQRDEIAVRLRKIEKTMIGEGKTREEIRVMAVEAWKGWLDGLEEEDRKNGIAAPCSEEKEKDSHRLRLTNWDVAGRRYNTYRSTSKVDLERNIATKTAEMRSLKRSKGEADYMVRGCWEKWNNEWPHVQGNYSLKGWVLYVNRKTERVDVGKRLAMPREKMRREEGLEREFGAVQEEWRKWNEGWPASVNDRVMRKWSGRFVGEGYEGGERITLAVPAKANGAGTVPPGFATWSQICERYNKRKDVSKQVFERRLGTKIQRMRSANWSEFEIGKALEPDWGMWRGQWPEMDAGDEERGRRMWETYRGKQRMVMEKQVEVKGKAMIAAGKSEAEIGDILNKGWGKWREEFPEIWSASDRNDEEEYEIERLATKIGEIEVTEREVDSESEVDESVYETDTEGRVDLRYSESVYDTYTDTDTEGGIDLGAWDSNSD